MDITRRELCAFLPAAALPAGLLWSEIAAVAQTPAAPLPSEVFQFDQLPVRGSNGVQTRAVLKGKLATGEAIEVHETLLPPGGAPHPAHHHIHSEMWLIREGTIEITIEGKPMRLGPGGVAFVKSNEEHGICNAGTTPTEYFVVAIGPGADA